MIIGHLIEHNLLAQANGLVVVSQQLHYFEDLKDPMTVFRIAPRRGVVLDILNIFNIHLMDYRE